MSHLTDTWPFVNSIRGNGEVQYREGATENREEDLLTKLGS